MRRRLIWPFVGALALAASVAPAWAQEPTVLKLSQFLGPNSFFAVDFAQPWARELEARTNGRVRVQLFDGTSPFGNVSAQAAQVRAGTIDIALGLRGAEAEKFPRTAIMELPFVVPDAARGSRVLWQLFQQGAFGPEFSDYKVLALFVHNPGLIHTATKPVRDVADLRGLRFRAPNQAVAATLESVGAVPVILQVNDVMPAVQSGRIDGIVTNWGNPLAGFNDYMKFHTDIAFYSSVFFVVMNKERFSALPPDAREAIDAQSGEVLVERFGALWTKWDKPVRDGATGPGQEIIVPDAAAMDQWRAALRPVTEKYLDDLVAGGFLDAKEVYARMVAMLGP
jgi:TRAP-type C4-dicarboxylate transport system substrate-binding protein